MRPAMLGSPERPVPHSNSDAELGGSGAVVSVGTAASTFTICSRSRSRSFVLLQFVMYPVRGVRPPQRTPVYTFPLYMFVDVRTCSVRGAFGIKLSSLLTSWILVGFMVYKLLLDTPLKERQHAAEGCNLKTTAKA